MSETMVNVLLQNWDYAMEQEDWAPPLKDALAGVDDVQALWKPEGEAANSIWETVNHLLYYKERLLRKFKGLPQLSSAENNDDTFTVAESGPDAWAKAVQHLREVHAELRAEIAKFGGGAFTREGERHAPGEEIMSLILHDSYHTGQIVLVRKLQGSWPAQRHFG